MKHSFHSYFIPGYHVATKFSQHSCRVMCKDCSLEIGWNPNEIFVTLKGSLRSLPTYTRIINQLWSHLNELDENISRQMSSLASYESKNAKFKGLPMQFFQISPNRRVVSRVWNLRRSTLRKKIKISNKSRILINDYTPYINQWNAIIHPGPKLTNFLRLYHRLVLIYHIEQWLWLFILFNF